MSNYLFIIGGSPSENKCVCGQGKRDQDYGSMGCGVFKRGYKIERFLHNNPHTERKLLNFENWVNGEVSHIGHHFRN